MAKRKVDHPRKSENGGGVATRMETPLGRAAHPVDAPLTRRPAGGIRVLGGQPLAAGVGASPLGLEADVSGELAAVAPTFGAVLESVGLGVATSQEALDRGLVDAARQLSETKITLVTEVIQQLDDDGLPDIDQTRLITQDVSLINYVNPTVHEWSHVALSMDLEVGALDVEQGMTFYRNQTDRSINAYGLFWGFVGWFDTDTKDSTQITTSRTRNEMDWASGQVRLDALLAPRRMEKFPVAAQAVIGPQIYFSQGSLIETEEEDVVTRRAVDVRIKVLKADGSVNPNVILEADSTAFDYSFSNTAPFTGSTTNADGEVLVTVSRDIPSPLFARRVRGRLTMRLGQISKSIELRL